MKCARPQSPAKPRSGNPARHRAYVILVTGLLATLIFIVSAPVAFAGSTITWDGGGTDNNWSTAANWAGDTLPTDGDDLLFTGTTRQANVSDMGDMTFGSVTFDTAGFSVSGATYTLTITKGIYNMSGGQIDWSVAVVMPGATEISTNAGATTKFQDGVVRLPKNAALTIKGVGTFDMGCALVEYPSWDLTAKGTTSFIIEGGTTLWYNGGGYTGTTTVKNGATLSFPKNAQYAVIGKVNLEAGSRLEGAAMIQGPLSIAGTVAPAAYSIVVSGDVTLEPGGSMELPCAWENVTVPLRLLNLTIWDSTNSLKVNANPTDGVFTIKPTFADSVDRAAPHSFAGFVCTPAITDYDPGDIVVDDSAITGSKGTTEVWLDEGTPKLLGVKYTPVATHTISCTLGTGATISPDISGTAGVITEGDDATYTFGVSASYPGKYISAVKIDNVAQDPIPTSYKFTNVTANHTIEVVTSAYSYTISASVGSYGGISPSGDTSVTYDGSQAYTITPTTGYHIADVLVDNVSNQSAITNGSYTFSNVKAGHTISATFAINTYTITPSAGTGGSISPSTVQTVNYDGAQAFTITATAGYHISDVLVDNVSNQSAITNGSYTFGNVASNHTISASFAADTTSNTGFLTPLLSTDPRRFRTGQTIPVKYRPANLTSLGTGSSLQAAMVLKCQPKPVSPTFTLKVTGPCHFSAGPYKMTYDTKNTRYCYNLSTRCWKAGTYTLTVKWSTGRTESVTVTVTK